jgi:MFS family permease
MSKFKDVILKVTILSLAISDGMQAILIVLLGDIAAYFPEASPSAVQMIFQCSMAGMFLAMTSVGFLARKYRIKPMVLIGLAILTIGGTLPLIYHGSLYFMWVCAFLIGGSAGMLLTLPGILILNIYAGDEKNTMLGLSAFAMGAGSSALIIATGQVAVRAGWVAAHSLYLLNIVVFVLVAIFLPLGDKPLPDAQASKEHSKAPVPAKGWIQGLILMFQGIALSCFSTNISMLIATQGLGDTTLTSQVITVNTIMTATIGLIFRFIVKRFKLYMGVILCAVAFTGMLLIFLATGAPMLFFAAICIGAMLGLNFPTNGYFVSRFARPDQMGATYSITTGAMAIGAMISAIVINAVTMAWAGKVSSHDAFLTATVWFGVALVIQFIWGTYLTRTTAPEDPKTHGAVSEPAHQQDT